MSSIPTGSEQRLGRVMGLCRRLLAQNEDLLRQIDRLQERLHWLATEYRELSARCEQGDVDHAVVEAAFDAMLGAVLDEPSSGTLSVRS